MNKYLILFLIQIILVSCSTTTNTVHIYTGKNEFYPVVVKVFEDNDIQPKSIDITKNKFTSNYIYQKNYGAKIRYTVTVLYRNNIISVELSNIQQYSFDDDSWFDEERFTYFDNTALTKKISNEISSILNNQEFYDQVKDEVYNSFLFHYLVIKNLPKQKKTNWINLHMIGREYNLNVTISKIEKNTTGFSTDKKYIAEFTNTGESKFNDLFVINYYTNNKNYSSVGSNTPLTITGKLLESTDIAELLIHSSHVYLVENE